MAGLLLHLITYLTVNAVLIAVWALGPDGSWAEFRGYFDHPSTVDASFWPIWVLLTWGAGLVIHAGSVVSFGLFGGRRRRRRRRARQEAAEPGPDAGPGVVVQTPQQGRHRPERRWVTVMFTDIVSSTQLTEALGDVEWSRLLRRHREMVRGAFLARGGEEVNTQGDGFLARFPSPADAVLCAVDIQRSLGEQRQEGAVAPRLRVGIHAGEAVHEDGDLIGRVVNIASRVAAEAEPDEILVTEPVADDIGAKIVLEDRGVRPLKGITQPRHLLSVRWADTPEVPAAPEPGTAERE